MNSGLGILLPRGAPALAVNRLNAAIDGALKQSDVREQLVTLGAEPAGGMPERMGAHLKAELARWTALARTVRFDAPH